MSEFDNFYWKHNDCLNKDTSLAHSFGEKVWNHQQAKIDSLTLEVAEMKSRLNDNYTSGQTSMHLTKQAKIDLLEVQLKGAEERAKLILDHKNKMVDELQKENDRLNTWYKNVKLQLENKQIDCDRSDREVDELQKKYDAMHNAFIVADDCRKDWHESYIGVYKQRNELQGRIDRVVHILTYTNHASTPLCNELRDILKGNNDEN